MKKNILLLVALFSCASVMAGQQDYSGDTFADFGDDILDDVNEPGKEQLAAAVAASKAEQQPLRQWLPFMIDLDTSLIKGEKRPAWLQASTVKAIGIARTRKSNPRHYDLLIVDEASGDSCVVENISSNIKDRSVPFQLIELHESKASDWQLPVYADPVKGTWAWQQYDTIADPSAFGVDGPSQPLENPKILGFTCLKQPAKDAKIEKSDDLVVDDQVHDPMGAVPAVREPSIINEPSSGSSKSLENLPSTADTFWRNIGLGGLAVGGAGLLYALTRGGMAVQQHKKMKKLWRAYGDTTATRRARRSLNSHLGHAFGVGIPVLAVLITSGVITVKHW